MLRASASVRRFLGRLWASRAMTVGAMTEGAMKGGARLRHIPDGQNTAFARWFFERLQSAKPALKTRLDGKSKSSAENHSMQQLKPSEIWFVTGSQHLYGPGPLEQVARHSQQIARSLDESADIPLKVVFKPIVTTPEEIRALCAWKRQQFARLWRRSSRGCTPFRPAKMWIGGLSVLTKPLLAFAQPSSTKICPGATLTWTL